MTIVAAALLGAVAGAVGAVASSQADRLPTGPTIVLVATAIVVASFLVAPRGLLVRRFVPVAPVTARDARRAADLAALEEAHGGTAHGHPAATIAALEEVDASVALRLLERDGLVRATRGELVAHRPGAEARRR